jgi:hypothetical protein
MGFGTFPLREGTAEVTVYIPRKLFRTKTSEGEE